MRPDFHRYLPVLYGVILCVAALAGYQAWQLMKHAIVVVEWTTASELDTAGFNLYRSEQKDGEFVRVNPNLIPASNDALTGSSYQFEDHSVLPGHTYYYRLEDLDTSGVGSNSQIIQVTAANGGRLELLVAGILALIGVLGLIFSLKTLPTGKGQLAEVK